MIFREKLIWNNRIAIFLEKKEGFYVYLQGKERFFLYPTEENVFGFGFAERENDCWVYYVDPEKTTLRSLEPSHIYDSGKESYTYKESLDVFDDEYYAHSYAKLAISVAKISKASWAIRKSLPLQGGHDILEPRKTA